jgi:hypothetical protein
MWVEGKLLPALDISKSKVTINKKRSKLSLKGNTLAGIANAVVDLLKSNI